MVASLSKPAAVDDAGVVNMSCVGGNIRGGKQESSLSTSAVKRASSASSSYACTVTPPMTLPSRGWGDRDSGSEGCGVRHLSGFSCNSTGDTGSTTGSCSSSGRSTNGSGSSCGSSAAGGGSNGGSLRTGAGIDREGKELQQFHLSDGFSSAEEETWGSEGEIEETVVAGRRRALVTLGPNKHLGANTSNNNNSSSRSTFAEEEDGDGDEESRGLLARGSGSRPAAASGAPACTGDGLVPGVGSRRKAAVGAGRAKRRHSFGARAGPRRDVEDRGAGGVSGSAGRGSGSGGICNGRGGGVCGGGGGGGGFDDREAGSSHKKRPVKVSRRLFIEIENKASEPPPPRRQAPAERGRAASRRQRGGAAVRGLEPGARTRRLGGAADGDADGDQGDSGDEAMCGCAERCLRLVDTWYRTLTGSTARVKFSELDQGVSSSIP